MKESLNKRVRRTKKELEEFYINPSEMEREIEQFYQSNVISDNLANMILKIAERLSLARNFYNYSYKNEMIGDAIVKMVIALKKKRFKCNQNFNPFSYFTKIAFRAFINRIKKEKREFDTLQRFTKEVQEKYRVQGVCNTTKNCSSTQWGSEDEMVFPL